MSNTSKKIIFVLPLLLTASIIAYTKFKSPNDNIRIASKSFKNSDFINTIKESNEGLDIRPNSQDLLNLKGQSHFFLKQYQQSSSSFHKLLKYSNDKNDSLWLAVAYNNLAETYRIKKNWKIALHYLNKAIQINRSIPNRKGEAINYHNMGKLFKSQNNLNKALEYYNISLDIKKDINDFLGIGNTYNEMGIIYELKNDFNKAWNFYNKSESMYNKTNSQYHLGIVYGNLGRINILRKSDDQAISYLQKALVIAENMMDYQAIAIRSTHLSIVYTRQGNFSLAREYYSKSIESRARLGIVDLKKEKLYLNKLKKLSEE